MTVIRSMVRLPCEAALVLLAWLILPWLPRRAIVALARGLGGAAWALCGRLRRVALANLAAVYGETLPAAERARIGRGAFTTFALVALDLFWFGAFTRSRLRRTVQFDASMDPLFATAPLVAVTAHLGNWEVLGLAVAERGAPLLSVAATVKSRVGIVLMNMVRRRTGATLAPQKGALRTLMRALRDGARVALLMDQNTREDEGGEFVEFFGLPAAVSKAAAALCARTGAPLFVACCVADEHGVYRAEGLPLITVGPAGVPEAQATAEMTRALERLIRRHPAAWMWMYKRWRYVPPGADAARFPFYAEPVRRAAGPATEAARQGNGTTEG
jgi:KDO2-lipid IV(A) lauroyltransferase